MELEVTLTCKVTSTGFCLAGELASISRKRMVLHMRRAMKMMGMRVSFLSAMVDSDWDVGLVAKMGRYSERASCWNGENGENVKKK